MTSPAIVRITNQPRAYPWGSPGGISRLLGWPPTEVPEAELWLGSHPLSPSRVVGPGAPWPDLGQWQAETGTDLPFLLKVLAAESPLSLQAHPTSVQAREGFAREEAAGIPLTAPNRNYKDPFAKPELIVAVEDGFEALCGFRPLGETRALAERLATLADDPAPFVAWRSLLDGDDPLQSAVGWLLGAGGEAAGLVSAITGLARRHPAELELAARLAEDFPGDPGIVIALMLNHARLAAGECLWLPAGNIHAYLRGVGVELMGPSDNVLRGGLTTKHVDVPELLRILAFAPGAVPYLHPQPAAAGAVVYRPPGATGFELWVVSGDSRIGTRGCAVAVVLDGEFVVAGDVGQMSLQRGEAALILRAASLRITGSGRLCLSAAA